MLTETARGRAATPGIKILDQAHGTRPFTGESQDRISVYEVTAAPGG